MRKDVEDSMTFEVICGSLGLSMGNGLGLWTDAEVSIAPEDGRDYLALPKGCYRT